MAKLRDCLFFEIRKANTLLALTVYSTSQGDGILTATLSLGILFIAPLLA